MHLLALSGSLREGSFNTRALRALQDLAPIGMTIGLYDGVGALPHFNPDVEGAALPDSIREFRRQVGAAEGLVIACPEYAHGLPGSFKNALDWLVGSEDFPGKPVMLINTAPRAFHAQAQLKEVLTTMSARLVHEAGVTLDLRHPDALRILRSALEAFVTACGSAIA
jgi:NAD(P)H-dependent FMN reductase